MTYGELYEKGRKCLEAAAIEEAALDARLLLEAVCGTDRNELLVHAGREVGTEWAEQYEGMIEQRSRHIPLQQITGEQEFMGLLFRVNEHVLIPRQDTEILVEEIMRDLHDGSRILDMCTGSGCILISLLFYSNGCVGTGADISEKALEAARENAGRLLACKQDDTRIEFIKSNLFENITERYDILVSNPPYIPTAVIPTLMEEVRLHEPIEALDGKEDGLFFYREIIREASGYLNKGGHLFFEIGCEQAEEVRKLLLTEGFQDIRIVKDYAGLDRVVCARY